MDFDTLSGMKVDELKIFLRARGLKVSGQKDHLVARAFSAIENDIQPVKTAEEVESQIKDEYLEKLQLTDMKLPDPFKIVAGWKDEEEGISFWPMMPTLSIINFLNVNSEVEDLSDYKASKAYSYFKQGWLGTISYHPLSGSKYCLLKCDCRPSERLRDHPHKIWICLTQKEGKIVTAHCSCMAGVGATCNHIAAALFRVEATMRLGLINPACTAKPCEWLPNRKEVKPQKIKDLNFNREDFGKRGKTSRKLLSSPKKNFTPVNVSHRLPRFEDFTSALEEIATNSVLTTAVLKPEIDFVREVVSIQENHINISSMDDFILLNNTSKELIDNAEAYFTDKIICAIEKSTRGQSTNSAWYEFRKHIITASKSHEVKTKMTKVKQGKGGYVNMWGLIQKISGFSTVNPHIPALVYGRENEPFAVNKFLEIFKKEHNNVTFSECGLFLDKESMFIGGSPDGIISCSCHGKACLEIKCSYSIAHITPSDESVALVYLKTVDGKLQINTKHNYYTQIQQQLAVTGLKTCYFFVYTSHGFHVEAIAFDTTFWDNCKVLFHEFYLEFYLKAIYK